jgi:hypothetical protein
MATIRASFVRDASDRSEALFQSISKTIRAAIIGRSGMLRVVDPTAECELQFVLAGTVIGDPVVSVDLSAEGADCDVDHATQPALRCLAVAGRKLMDGASAKVAALDSEAFGWRLVHEDASPIDHEHALSESAVFGDPSLLANASHVLMVSKTGRPLMVERLIAQQCCAVFSTGANSSLIDRSWIVDCIGHADFLQKAEGISKTQGGTPAFFKKNVANKAFSEMTVSARDARAILGSLLRKKAGQDFGLLDLHVADRRLVEAASRGVKN